MTQQEANPPDIESIRQGAYSSGYFRLLDISIDAATEGIGEVHTHVDARLMQPQQIVHGGVIFTLADTAMSMALMSVLPPGTRFSTIEAKINFLVPVRSGELTAVGTIIHKGRSTAVLEATVYNQSGEERQIIARTMGTFSIAANKTVS